MAQSLSICIPTYNRVALLRDTLIRLAATPHAIREVVVSDNASPDATEAMVAALRPRFERLVYFRHAKTVDMMANFQTALSLGTSDLLFPLSDDDALLPARIAEAVALLESDPSCVAVYGGYERCDSADGATHHVAVPKRAGRFGLADLDAIAETANLLTVPLVRRGVFQRHCFLDATTFGFMRLITQLLGHGAIRIVDYPLYRHVGHSPHSAEARVAQPWYQEALRSDWEQFAAASPGAGNFATLAQFTASRVLPAYLLAFFAAQADDQPLLERSFLVRYLAYAAEFPETQARERIEQWETTRLIAAAIARLGERLGACAGLKRVVIEQGRVNIPALWQRLQAGFPSTRELTLDYDAFVAFECGPGDFMLAERWETLEARARAGIPSSPDQVAVLDIVASLRLPGSPRLPLLRGPDRTDHFCLEPRR